MPKKIAKANDPILLTIEEAGQRLNCSRSTVINMINDGKLEAVKLRHLTRIPEASLMKFIDQLQQRKRAMGAQPK